MNLLSVSDLVVLRDGFLQRQVNWSTDASLTSLSMFSSLLRADVINS